MEKSRNTGLSCRPLLAHKRTILCLTFPASLVGCLATILERRKGCGLPLARKLRDWTDDNSHGRRRAASLPMIFHLQTNVREQEYRRQSDSQPKIVLIKAAPPARLRRQNARLSTIDCQLPNF